MTYPVKGYLPDRTMPARLSRHLRPLPFGAVMAHLGQYLKSSGGDYDIPNEPPVYDQGDMGSCVLNATCGAMNMLLAVEGQPTAILSRLFLYWLCRLSMGTTGSDSGTFPSLAVDRVTSVGACQESFWPYLDSNLYAAPPPECYPEASDNRAAGWFPLDSSGYQRLIDVELAVRANHPVVFGAAVGSEMQTYQAGQVLDVPLAQNIVGGHSMVVSGLRYLNGTRVWRVRNSWGPNWGDNGHCLLSDAYMAWGELGDCQVLTRMSALCF